MIDKKYTRIIPSEEDYHKLMLEYFSKSNSKYYKDIYKLLINAKISLIKTITYTRKRWNEYFCDCNIEIDYKNYLEYLQDEKLYNRLIDECLNKLTPPDAGFLLNVKVSPSIDTIESVTNHIQNNKSENESIEISVGGNQKINSENVQFYKSILEYLKQETKPLDLKILKILNGGHCDFQYIDLAFRFDSDDVYSTTRIIIYIPIEKYDEYDSKLYDERILEICRSLSDPKNNLLINEISVVIQQNDVVDNEDNNDCNMNYHPYIQKNCLKYYNRGEYFDAVSCASRYYTKTVKDKTGSNNDGTKLMTDIFRKDKPIIKLTKCESQSEIDYQEGFMHMSMGLVCMFRNPTSHETAESWSISKEDCLDILTMYSYMLRKLDFNKIDGENDK